VGVAGLGALSIQETSRLVRGTTLNVAGVYTDGASRYNFQNLAPQSFAMYRWHHLPGAYTERWLCGVADGVFANGSGISSVQTLGYARCFHPQLGSYWNTALYVPTPS